MINNNLDYLKQHPYVSDNASIEIHESPFPYYVIKNLLKPEIYDMISSGFMDLIGKTKPYKDLPGAVHNYSAHIYGLKREDCKNSYDFFVDGYWKNFNMMTFGILVNKYIALSAHWHQAPAEPGFIHNDCNICSVLDDKNTDYTLTGNCYYSDDTESRQPNSTKICRSIASLYYLNNNPTKPNDGGTSIYGNYKFYSKIKDIPATSNSVFTFAVKPNSYHGFSGARYNRSALVQWFHSSPSYMLSRYKEEFINKNNKYGSPFERWQPTEKMWDIRKDPEYTKFLGNKKLTLQELMS